MTIKPEILAPAGRWDALEAVVAAGTDAVYLGGKRCNMRLQAKDFNFDDAELARAVEFVHARGRKIFVTLNNLQTSHEIDEISDYIAFLREVGPDAVIIQDLGILRLLHELKWPGEIHVSTMVNAHNPETLRLLARHGVTRVVLSKDLRLSDVRRLHRETGMDLEYFVHGDTCIAHHGSCNQSGVVFGASSNKGRCYKSCRWDYDLVDGGNGEHLAAFNNGPYLLAQNDLCLLSHVPELIHAGVRSFKIEGRMRAAEYLSLIVGLYRRALDRYFEDPSGYLFNIDDLKEILANRVRDLTTGSALHGVRIDSVGATGDREPKFFSKPVREKRLVLDEVSGARIDEPSETSSSLPFLSVRVGDVASASAAIASRADAIIIGGDVSVSRGTPWRLADVRTCIAEGHRKGVEVYVSSPSYLMWREMNEFAHLVRSLRDTPPDGYVVSDPGVIDLLRGLGQRRMTGDFSLNVMNHKAAGFLAEEGIFRVALSRELSLRQCRAVAERTDVETEVLVHGPVESMRLDHCLIAALALNMTSEDVCPAPCRSRRYALRDSAGEIHDIEPDQFCRNHLLMATDVCTLPLIRAFAGAGFASLRIDAQYDAPDHVAAVVAAYRRAIHDPSFTVDQSLLDALAASGRRPLSLGPHARNLSIESHRPLAAVAED